MSSFVPNVPIKYSLNKNRMENERGLASTDTGHGPLYL